MTHTRVTLRRMTKRGKGGRLISEERFRARFLTPQEAQRTAYQHFGLVGNWS